MNGFVNDGCLGSIQRFIEIARHFSLAIHSYLLAVGEPGEVDMTMLAMKRDVESGVRLAFRFQAVVDIRFAQQIDEALFEYPGSDAPEHVFP